MKALIARVVPSLSTLWRTPTHPSKTGEMEPPQETPLLYPVCLCSVFSPNPHDTAPNYVVILCQ